MIIFKLFESINIVKCVAEWIKPKMEYITVNFDYPKKIRLEGYEKLRWSKPKAIESRKLEGYEIVAIRTGKNKLMNIKTGFKLNNDDTLIGKRK